MDRTNWMFSEVNINILMLGLTHKSIAFPLIFKLLTKRGNSNWKGRKDFMLRFIRLFEYEYIDSLVADREFIGKEWIEFLNNMGIRYYIRIRQNFWVQSLNASAPCRVWWLFNNLKVGQEKSYPRLLPMKGEYVYLAGIRIKNSEGIAELQILICFNKPNSEFRRTKTLGDRYVLQGY